jgi:hypothetical protein
MARLAVARAKRSAAKRFRPLGIGRGRKQQRAGGGGRALAAPLADRISALRAGGGGAPIPESARRPFGTAFGDGVLDRVRVHTGPDASALASALGARAFTVGSDIGFGYGEFQAGTPAGRRLIAHELAHTAQPDGNEVVRRQLVTPLGPGGGFGGLMERDRQRARAAAAAPPPTPFQVCARPLQGALGALANHSYVEAPPFRYAIISPLCPAGKFDNPVTGTTAQKWDNSPDPCGNTPTCLPCHPAPGVTDVASCLRSAFSGYASLSRYRALGPNSNTFAGTLARTCCAGMVPKPAAFGTVPGWDDAPAPARAGGTPCPPGPTC